MSTVQLPDTDESLNQQTSLSVAELFINARKAQGYSIEDIARHLRVARSYIEAIESNSISGLPSRVYTLGFIRSYANFLNQDSAYFVKRFKEEVLGDPVNVSSLSFPTTLTLDSSPQKNILWLSSGILVIILSLGFWHWGPHSKPETNLEKKFTVDPLKENLALELSKEDPPSSSSDFSLHSANNIEQPSENTKQEELPSSLSQPTLTSPAAPAQVSLPFPSVENSSAPLKLIFSETCWLRIENGAGQVVIEKTFQEGDQYTISSQNHYILHTGNAGAIEISSSLMPEAKILGKKGQVIQNLSLDSQALSAYLNQQ